jgi:RND family efflux transporter MFP subunit
VRTDSFTCRIVFALIACVLGLAGCNRKPETAKVPPPPSVRVHTVAKTGDQPTVAGVGMALWRLETPLGFTTAGQIDRIAVVEGQYVRKGQLLATLRNDVVGAEYSSARAQADLARADLGRIGKLYREGWVTKARFESEQARVIAATATVQAKSFAFETSRIVAPSNGVILSRQAEPSQVVGAGSPILVLGQASGGRIIRVPVSDRIIAVLRIGQNAQVTFEALPGKPFVGKVLEIGGKASGTTGSFDVEVSLPEDPAIRSGLIGRVRFLSNGTPDSGVFLVPSAAIVSPRAGQGVVYVLAAGNRVSARSVTLGEVVDNGVLVVDGLQAGDRLILSAHDRLQDGMRVTPLPQAAE